MATTYKVLAQAAPAEGVNTDAYTVGSGKQAVISTITVCNRDGSASSYRISVRPGGATLSDEHYVAYDATAPASDTIAITLGITLNSTDVLTLSSANGFITFNVFGSEIS